MSPPVLQLADFTKPFVVQTDSSSVALGEVIYQEVDNSRLPISYASLTLTDQEKKYSAYELECLAIVFAFEKFKPFLEHKEFLLETDNQALSWLLNHLKQLGLIGRWVLRLNCYKFKVQHIRGTQNVVADTLSRMFQPPNKTSESKESRETPIINTLITEFPLAFTNIAQYQQQDPHLKTIIEQLDKGNKSEKYILSKRVLCYRIANGKSLRIIAPDIIKPMLMEYYHSSTIGAHMGINKTIHRIRKNIIGKI